MANMLPPVRGVAFYFEVSLISITNRDIFQSAPTLAPGDCLVIKDGVLDGNMDALPVAVAGCTNVVGCTLSAAEMTADRVTVLFHDAAGAEWQDMLVTLYTSGQTLDDIASGVTVFPAGAIEYTYTVTDSISGFPIDGVQVWFSTDLGGTNIVWAGVTDALGVARDVLNSKPWLNAGTYYAWRQKAGYAFENPGTEVVS